MGPLGTYEFAPGSGNAITLAASADGNTIADAIRLVGVAAPPGDIVYIHSDHLGTPQKITDDTQTVVWDRVQDPFGQQVSLTSSGGIDTTLRFPGQQFDAETGFHYNVWRDYDPGAGRYIESDPIGIEGGVNIYAYVNGNPLNHMDPRGKAPDNRQICQVSPMSCAQAFSFCIASGASPRACADALVICNRGLPTIFPPGNRGQLGPGDLWTRG